MTDLRRRPLSTAVAPFKFFAASTRTRSVAWHADTVLAVLHQRLGRVHPSLATLEKAVVAAGAANTWGGPLAETIALSDAFMGRQRRATVLGRLRESMRRVPFNTFVGLTSQGSTAAWAGTAAPIRVSRLAFDREALSVTKIGVIVVVSNELARSIDPSVVALIENDLITASARREDEALLSQEPAIPDVQPAGLLYGLTDLGSGGSPGSIDADVTDLIRAVRGADPESPFFIASRWGALHLATVRDDTGARLFPNVNLVTGGDILGIPLIISHGAESRLILVDAAAIAVADVGAEITPSTQSAVVMDDAPSAGPNNTVSLFQADSTGLRCVRFVHWKKGYADAAAFIELPAGSPS